MEFNLHRSLEILSATPKVLDHMLGGLSREWLFANEGEGTWSPHIVVSHLVFSEEVNWIPRMKKVLSASDNIFAPFDPRGQFDLYSHHTLRDLLDKFAVLRKDSVRELSTFSMDEETLLRKGIHPTFGEVTLSQLLSTWTVHDLDHINQISRVLAKQYKEAVGPWVSFLGVLKRPL